jgi:hypothetical protein
VIEGPGAQPRVVLMGRLAVYGAGAARLHEEVIPVTAIWIEAERDRRPLKPLGETGEERTLNQLEEALRHARAAPAMAVARVTAMAARDIADLAPAFERLAVERLAEVKGELAKRGAAEARLLAELLERQRKRIDKASAEFDPRQLLLPGVGDEERREREADRRHWGVRLERLDKELREEPQRIRASYAVQAHRLEPVGLVYSGRRRAERMAAEVKRNPDLEWLDHVQPVGLTVAPIVLEELGLAPERQTQADTTAVAEHVKGDPDEPVFRDPWKFFAQVLGWEARHVAGSPGGPLVPGELDIRLPEHDTTLSPTWAVRELARNGQPWQLLVRIEAPGVDPDARGTLHGWEATPHQRFERLLRESGVFAGLLVSEKNAGKTDMTTMCRSCGWSTHRVARRPAT